ncbi:DUF6402 family protein [Burkholderia pseudomallei]|uniref:DUF6402 family protein n=1 Tax=Burkholderia pseudomallei TaxID=28450 RepID=UPI000AB89EA4|nr:DUF6402 family protein [Burkholderia pseudomallei]
MTTPNRIAYFKPEKAVFSRRTEWKKDLCKPLNNPQAHVLMDRAPDGWTPPPAPPKAEESKADKKVEKKAEKQPPDPPKPATPTKSKSSEDDDDCRTPPPFDMLDLPDAMEKMGFYVAAKLSRRWFNGRKNIIGNASDRYPEDMVDSKTVSLDFTLRYGGAEAKLLALVNREIYTDNAIKALKANVHHFVSKQFIDHSVAFSGEIDSWKLSNGDIQDLHKNYQFQLIKVTDLETLDENAGATDLTASLGNFFYMAAIANAKIYSEKYYNYTGPSPRFCCESRVEVTHIYVYARDSYSFADKPGGTASQYLGHWNRYGMIVVPAAAAANTINNGIGKKGGNLQWGNHPDTPPMPFIYDNGFKKPVDIINGLFKSSLRKQDVYYPIYNSDYNAWRQKYDRGGDFVIYSNLKKIALPKPIKFTLEEVCKPCK